MSENVELMDQLRRKLISDVENGRSIASIAKSAEIDRTQLSRFLHSQRSLSLEQWLGLASALDVTVFTDIEETKISVIPPKKSEDEDPIDKIQSWAQELDKDEVQFLMLVLKSRRRTSVEAIADKLKWDPRHVKAIARLINLRLLSFR